jgi:ribonuclease D
MSSSQEAAAEILKLALKIVSERDGIAPKLLASSADIDAIAVDDNANVPALQGWRRELFGEVALDLKHGRAAITMEKGRVQIVKR